MKETIQSCTQHDYIYIRKDTVISSGNPMRLIQKESYACVKCGSGLDVYDLDKDSIVEVQS